MSLTESSMLALGTTAPDFTLPNTVSGNSYSLASGRGTHGTLIIFMCNHCPYVVHILDSLIAIANQLQLRGISTIAISSNSALSHPQDAPDKMQQLAIAKKFPFAYLYDETQEVARAYSATCTPDLFLFDGANALVYRGRYDDSTPGNNRPVTGADLLTAAEQLLQQQPITSQQHPSMGCNIKWH